MVKKSENGLGETNVWKGVNGSVSVSCSVASTALTYLPSPFAQKEKAGM
jgi:hypothetical protein